MTSMLNPQQFPPQNYPPKPVRLPPTSTTSRSASAAASHTNVETSRVPGQPRS
jgi:hypothetical protein